MPHHSLLTLDRMTKKSQIDKLNDEIISCYKCPRLVAWREEVARVKRKAFRDQEYWGKPVPGFGDHDLEPPGNPAIWQPPRVKREA